MDYKKYFDDTLEKTLKDVPPNNIINWVQQIYNHSSNIFGITQKDLKFIYVVFSSIFADYSSNEDFLESLKKSTDCVDSDIETTLNAIKNLKSNNKNSFIIIPNSVSGHMFASVIYKNKNSDFEIIVINKGDRPPNCSTHEKFIIEKNDIDYIIKELMISNKENSVTKPYHALEIKQLDTSQKISVTNIDVKKIDSADQIVGNCFIKNPESAFYFAYSLAHNLLSKKQNGHLKLIESTRKMEINRQVISKLKKYYKINDDQSLQEELRYEDHIYTINKILRRLYKEYLKKNISEDVLYEEIKKTCMSESLKECLKYFDKKSIFLYENLFTKKSEGFNTKELSEVEQFYTKELSKVEQFYTKELSEVEQFFGNEKPYILKQLYRGKDSSDVFRKYVEELYGLTKSINDEYPEEFIKKNYTVLIKNINYPRITTSVIMAIFHKMNIQNDISSLTRMETYLINMQLGEDKIPNAARNYILGCYYYSMKDWDNAKKYLAKSFKSNPTFIKSYSEFVNDGTHLNLDSFLDCVNESSYVYKILKVSMLNNYLANTDLVNAKSLYYAYEILKLDKNNPEANMREKEGFVYSNNGILTDEIFKDIENICTLFPEKYYNIKYNIFHMDPDTISKFINLGENLLNYSLDKETALLIKIQLKIHSLLLKVSQGYNFNKEMDFIAQNLPQIKNTKFIKNLVKYLAKNPLIKDEKATKNYILGCCYANMKEYIKSNYYFDKAFTYNTYYAKYYDRYFKDKDKKISYVHLREALAKTKSSLIEELNAYITKTSVYGNELELKDLETELTEIDIFSLDLNKIFYTEEINKEINAKKVEIATIILENVDFKESDKNLGGNGLKIKNKLKMMLWDSLLQCDKNTLKKIYSPVKWIDQVKEKKVQEFFNFDEAFRDLIKDNPEKIDQLYKFVSILKQKEFKLKNDNSNLNESLKQFRNNSNNVLPNKIKLTQIRIIKIIHNFIEMCKNLFKKKDISLEKIKIPKEKATEKI